MKEPEDEPDPRSDLKLLAKALFGAAAVTSPIWLNWAVVASAPAFGITSHDQMMELLLSVWSAIAGALGIWFVIHRINRRSDPRHMKFPGPPESE